MDPWVHRIPCAVTLLSCVVALYLMFSPIGLVGGLSQAFWPLLLVVVIFNIAVWWRSVVRNSASGAVANHE
jgi:SSS family solute:Na+ symporter